MFLFVVFLRYTDFLWLSNGHQIGGRLRLKYLSTRLPLYHIPALVFKCATNWEENTSRAHWWPWRWRETMKSTQFGVMVWKREWHSRMNSMWTTMMAQAAWLYSISRTQYIWASVDDRFHWASHRMFPYMSTVVIAHLSTLLFLFYTTLLCNIK